MAELNTPPFRYIHVVQEEYEQLLKDAAKLRALEAAGVDNWDGYDEAMSYLE